MKEKEGYRKLEIGIFYLCVHKKIYEKVGLGGYITKDDFFTFLGKMYRVPKVLKIIILKEMEKKKMIEIIDKKFIKINSLIFDPEEDVNKLYEAVGLF